MARKVMLLATSPPPEDSPRSPLHLSQYSLPSSSRLPKVMIAGVAGLVLMTAVVYYVCKWFVGRKCRSAAVAAAADPESSPPEAAAAAGSLEEIQARVAKSLAQRLGSKIASAIPVVSYAELAEIRKRMTGGGEAGVESEACAVCLTEFSKNPAGTKIKLLPKCAHAFHTSCIDVWLMTQASCPICRASLFVALAELNLSWSRGTAAAAAVAEAEAEAEGHVHVCLSPTSSLDGENTSPPQPAEESLDQDRV